MPTFSIIIPAYNEEKYIRKTLHSIKNQINQDYEVIVVANSCTDKTEEIVKKRKNVHLLSLPKPNVSVARNAGALNANGEILIFLDADTQLAEDALQKIKTEFTEQSSVATTKALPDSDKTKFKIALGCKNLYLSSGLYQGCSGILICRKEDFDEVGKYDPEITVREHRKLILKLLEKGKYKCIDTYVINSMRRFKQWGLKKAAFFWIKQWLEDKKGNLSKSEYEKVR
ncbi:MAG: glycosyltransferase [Nanoarchaeota archaeon]